MSETGIQQEGQVNSATTALGMKKSDLEQLFRSSPAGEIPSGKSKGTALIFPGTKAGRIAARLTRLLFWQGKSFESSPSILRNRLTPLGIEMIKAEVVTGLSLLDHKPCIVLDYSKTSKSARWIRDEIRQAGPTQYIGLVYIRSHLIPVQFWLSFA